MIGDEIQNNRQLKEVKMKITEDPMKKLLLKSVYYCGSKVAFGNHVSAVAVVRNNETAKFVGNTSCKSPWCCPVCTSKRMAKYASDIAVAIDALKERGQVAAMITFTIPHTRGFSCEQATQILYNTWKAFTVHGNGKVRSNPNDVFKNCMQALESKHRVRVTEYTFGNAGWHPHFHCLFWFPAEKLQELLEWEELLKNRWLELCKRYTIKELLIGYPETQRKTVKAKVTTRVNIMYNRLNSESNAVHISKDENNLVRVQESSQYICGWGANREITGNYQNKATAEGHYTWQQILQLAIDTKQEKWWQLYFEYAIATRKYRHARVNFSVHSGIKQIIAAYKQTENYKTFAKKNYISQVEKSGRWRTVCWFTPLQWSEICYKHLEPDILNFAVNGGLTEINRLLERNGIPPAVQMIEATEILEKVLNAA